MSTALARVQGDARYIAQGFLHQSEVLLGQFLVIDADYRLGDIQGRMNGGPGDLDTLQVLVGGWRFIRVHRWFLRAKSDLSMLTRIIIISVLKLVRTVDISVARPRSTDLALLAQPGGDEQEVQHFKQAVGDERHEGGGHRPGQYGGDVVERESGDDGCTVAAGSDQGRQRRRTDADDGGGFYPREHRGARERQYDAEKHLPAHQSKGAGIFHMLRLHGAHAGEGIQHHGQQAVQAQRGRRRFGADAEQGNEKAQQRQRRHRLNQRADDQNRLSGGMKPRRRHAQRDADQNRKQQRHAYQPEMFARAPQDVALPALRARRFGS